MATKVDNANLAGKLALRRYFLQKYHADAPPVVLDCCQGSAVIWSTLRREFETSSYWGLDQKPKPGRLQVDSARVLALPGWRADVVDVDTYGSPWKHWLALVATLERPVTVFLTVGQWQMGTDGKILETLGLDRFSRRLPAGLARRVQDHALGYLLAAGRKRGVRIVEGMEAPRTRTARYLGLRLEY